MVLPELCGGIALALEDLGQRWVGFLDAARRAGDAMVVMPVRMGSCPVMKAARPAVQLGWA